MKSKIILLTTTLIAFTSSLSAQALVMAAYSANITFGYDSSVYDDGTYDSVGDTWGRIYDSTGTTPLAADDSVAALGYFNNESLSYSANLDIFDDFEFIPGAETNVEVFGSDTYPGDFRYTTSSVDVTAANGKTPYLVVFKGVTDVSSYASATEFALISADYWDVIFGSQPPSTPAGLVYTIGRTAIGSGVYVGTEVDDDRFAADEGYNYNTAVVVPEPSSFALLLGLTALLFVARRR